MFAEHNEIGYLPVLEKIERKTLVYGTQTLMCEFRLQQGANLPAHSHPHEQTGYLVSGSMRLTIGTECRLLAPGDSWCISGDVPHFAEALSDCVAVEVFSPMREDYLP